MVDIPDILLRGPRGMARLLKRRTDTIGLAPGTVVFVGRHKATRDVLDVFEYTEAYVREYTIPRAEPELPEPEGAAVRWINIDGLDDVALLKHLGERFGIHDLVLEDIANTGQRPKIEDHGDHLYIVIKMLYNDPEDGGVESEQVSLVIGKSCVLTFQEREGDVFGPVRQRLREDASRVRKKGADYLGYALLDMIVDNYYLVLERVGQRLEQLEQEVIANPTPPTLQAVHAARTDLAFVRKAVWPLRELVMELERTESPLIEESTRRYIRDLRDHTLHILDTVETFREAVGSLQDIYLSQVSNRMNEVMKTLTIMATMFIPLTFVAGVYGMNFEHMPELHWRYGYLAVWGIMLAVGLVMLIHFKRKRWL